MYRSLRNCRVSYKFSPGGRSLTLDQDLKTHNIFKWFITKLLKRNRRKVSFFQTHHNFLFLYSFQNIPSKIITGPRAPPLHLADCVFPLSVDQVVPPPSPSPASPGLTLTSGSGVWRSNGSLTGGRSTWS